MNRARIGLLGTLLVIAPAALSGQAAPTAATYITDEEVKAVNATPGVDRQIRVLDMGEYQLAVGIVHRGPAGPAAPAPAPTASPTATPCGETGTPTGDVARGIAHDATTETYVIVSGSGTLVTGGRIVNGRRSAPESSVTRVLNGPSCSGTIDGPDVVRKVVKTGDIIIIPAGVPHGWIDIPDHVDYLSIRPDLDKVLESGYVHPAIGGTQ
jgi:mannose-6-phosphate isomerase-like protein (cupin superfamily)